jgi:hypothetical protein
MPKIERINLFKKLFSKTDKYQTIYPIEMLTFAL